MSDRRSVIRRPVELFFNKYLAGHPYLCRSLDLSRRGVLAVTFTEPSDAIGAFPLELRIPQAQESLWVWARGVWRRDGRQAIEFLSMAEPDRRSLDWYLSGLN